jgi:hypothetical protein
LETDAEKRQYLTSKANSLFSLKREFMKTSGVKKEKLFLIMMREEEGLFHDPFGVLNKEKALQPLISNKREDYFMILF